MTASPESTSADKTSVTTDSQALSAADAVAFRIRVLSQRLNLSQAQLCRLANLPPQTLSSYWTGRTVPRAGQLFAIADALGCNPRWLATGAGRPEAPVEIDPENADDEARLLDAFRRLRPEQRAHVLANAEMLLDLVVVPYGGSVGAERQTVHSPPRAFRHEEKDR
jgi:transcriptional regulator with XRE-family HTH domain